MILHLGAWWNLHEIDVLIFTAAKDQNMQTETVESKDQQVQAETSAQGILSTIGC